MDTWEAGMRLALTSTKSAVSIMCSGAHKLTSGAQQFHHPETCCASSDSRIIDGIRTESGTRSHILFRC